jgi:ethanolamine ammonia-lyase large subunit
MRRRDHRPQPAADELDTIIRLEQLLESVVTRLGLPTRYCVLSDIVKQHQARSRTRVDVGFQSLAGTSRALNGIVGLDATAYSITRVRSTPSTSKPVKGRPSPMGQRKAWTW